MIAGFTGAFLGRSLPTGASEGLLESPPFFVQTVVPMGLATGLERIV